MEALIEHWRKLKTSRKSEHVKYISFSRNFGKEAAILAGFQHARGDAVVVMDADLQHPTYLLHDFIKGYEEGYDQVVAQRNRKGDNPVRSYLSSLYYRFINNAVEVDLRDGVGDFRLLSRKAVNAMLKLSEGNRFSKGLFCWIGFDQKIVYYENVERKNGKSKWSFRHLLNYGIDGIVSFNNRPLRMCFTPVFLSFSIAYLYRGHIHQDLKIRCDCSRLFYDYFRRPVSRRRSASQPRNYRRIHRAHLL